MIKKFKEYFKESISFPTSEDQIVQLCKRFKIRDYSINSDLSIDVEGGVDISYSNLKSLPLKFSRVGGDFYCYSNLLTTLKGCPREVRGDFDCSSNQLTTLEGSPIEVRGDFDCNFNQLTTLEGSPREVGGDFYCTSNHIASLKGSPIEVGGDFNCSYNPVSEIIDKFPDPKKVYKFWDDFDVVRNGNDVSAYRFKELYLDVTGEEFKGDLMWFRGYKVVE